MAKEKEIGFVKCFDSEYGFGFINRERGNDVFFHFSGLQGDGYKSLDKGKNVEFAIAEGTKGLQAKEVIKIS